MGQRTGLRQLTRVVLGGLCCLAVVGVAGCGDDDDAAGARGPASTSIDGAPRAASNGDDLLARAQKGLYSRPPADPNPAVKGKKILIITPVLAAETDSGVIDKVEEAASSLGWSTSVCDGKADPSLFPKCMAQAVTDDVDGVVSVGIDCPLIKPQLKQAIDKGIKTVGVFGWDCNQIDPRQPKMMTRLSYGSRFDSELAAFREAGKAAAAWLAKEIGGEGDVIYLTNKEYTTLKLMQEGFEEGMREMCPDCRLHPVDWLAKELGPQLQAKTQAALLKVPNAKGMYANVDPELGPSTAVVQANKQNALKVVGGLGLSVNYKALQDNKGLNAITAWPGGWMGYGAIDTLISLFKGEQPRDQGVGPAISDKGHLNPPAKKSGYFDPPGIRYEDVYKKSWGVN